MTWHFAAVPSTGISHVAGEHDVASPKCFFLCGLRLVNEVVNAVVLYERITQK